MAIGDSIPRPRIVRRTGGKKPKSQNDAAAEALARAKEIMREQAALQGGARREGYMETRRRDERASLEAAGTRREAERSRGGQLED